MTIKSELGIFFAAVVLASAVSAHAEGATIPDPNLATSPGSEESELFGASLSGPTLAAIPDPNLDPSSSIAVALIRPSDGPWLASIPDPDVAPSAIDEQAQTQRGLLAALRSDRNAER
jgi:hypothetical protein